MNRSSRSTLSRLAATAFRLGMIQLLFVFLLLSSCVCRAQGRPGRIAVESVQGDATSVSIHLQGGTLRIQPCHDNIARVTYFLGGTAPDLTNPFVLKDICATTRFKVQKEANNIKIVTPELTISVSRKSGAVAFLDPDGKTLIHESDWPFPRELKAITTDGEATHRASVWFALTPQERFYGLGQHQDGILNQRNLEFDLTQDNTNISIPFFLSSKGYGIFWNNASATRWNNRFQPVLNISSNVANAVDYFFIYGPDFDKIIAGYRGLTGNAPLFPRWAYGYWQSKLAYKSQAELLGVAAKYRRLNIPLDNIVLDAGWETLLGSRVFNKEFPDPHAMVQQLHKEHVHIMVSIWPLFQPGSATFQQMQQKGFFVTPGVNHLPAYYPGTRLYDAFSAPARELYWQQVQKSLYDIGVDAFWMDSTEPSDLYGEEHGSMLAGAGTAMGNGSRDLNLFPFMTTEAIYNGQRSVSDQKRVFILSRSAFAGMQHHAAAAWSGDIATNFQTLKREIPAGLNYSMTGLPYWTTDIGGFLGGNTQDPAYREVFVRWFQYGSFCPIFRVHGTRTNNENELWSYGRQAQSILTLYDRLRYRLLPYIYTMAAQTTFDGYTPMRALAFDFRNDRNALDISDEFMFGPSLLVAPVTSAGAASREVYLPAGPDWYDFWTGERLTGGQSINRQTPLAVMPLYVRAGTILPLGPESNYSDEHPDAPIELRIYAGADATYSLYEDDGTSYNYEKGQFARISMHWNDKIRVLTLDARQGDFPGMPNHHRFSVVLVKQGRGVGEPLSSGGRIIQYDGSAQQIKF